MELRADELRLARYDALLAMQPLYQEIMVRTGDIGKAKSEELENAAELERTRREMEALAGKLDVARERTADAERQLELRSAAINRGHALTGEINVATEQLKRLDGQLAEAERTLETLQNIVAAKKEMLEKVGRETEQQQLHDRCAEYDQHRTRITQNVQRLLFDK